MIWRQFRKSLRLANKFRSPAEYWFRFAFKSESFSPSDSHDWKQINIMESSFSYFIHAGPERRNSIHFDITIVQPFPLLILGSEIRHDSPTFWVAISDLWLCLYGLNDSCLESANRVREIPEKLSLSALWCMEDLWSESFHSHTFRFLHDCCKIFGF